MIIINGLDLYVHHSVCLKSYIFLIHRDRLHLSIFVLLLFKSFFLKKKIQFNSKKIQMMEKFIECKKNQQKQIK